MSGCETRVGKILGDTSAESRADCGAHTFLEKGKIISGSCPGGVWGFHPGYSVSIEEGTRLWKIPGRSVGWILKEKVSSKREKSSREDALDVKPELERLWEICQGSLGLIAEHRDSSRREKSFWVAALEESGVATWIYGA